MNLNDTTLTNLTLSPSSFDPDKISGIGEYAKGEPSKTGGTTFLAPNNKVFLVQHKTTIEIRTESRLRDLLTQKYESVMISRYFGKNGIEIVLADQLESNDVADLIRLSYNLTSELSNES